MKDRDPHPRLVAMAEAINCFMLWQLARELRIDVLKREGFTAHEITQFYAHARDMAKQARDEDRGR